MIRVALYIIILLTSIGMSSCETDLTLPENDADRKVVLLGELVAGDSIYIRAGQSTPISSENIKFEVINDLSINVLEDKAATYPLIGKQDSLSPFLYTVPFYSNNIIKAGSTYKLTTSHPRLQEAIVDVKIPAAFKANVIDTGITMYASDTVLRVSININDPAGENYYVIEALKQLTDVNDYFFYKNEWLNKRVYTRLYDSLTIAGEILKTKSDTILHGKYVRHGIYTKDELTENAKMVNQYAVNKRVFLTDRVFRTGAYTIEIFVRKNEFLLDDKSDRGITHILVKTVTREYFDYLKAYEQSSNKEGFSTTTYPEKIEGNVQGGLGVIGGAYQVKFTYRLDTY